MSIFAKETHAQVRGDVVVFSLETGGVVRPFEISGDVLRERFGAADGTGAELLRAFERAGDPIRALAKRAQWVPAEGLIELGTGDFEET